MNNMTMIIQTAKELSLKMKYNKRHTSEINLSQDDVYLVCDN